MFEVILYPSMGPGLFQASVEVPVAVDWVRVLFRRQRVRFDGYGGEYWVQEHDGVHPEATMTQVRMLAITDRRFSPARDGQFGGPLSIKMREIVGLET